MSEDKMLMQGEDGKWRIHDPYATIDFETKEDYEKLGKMLEEAKWHLVKKEHYPNIAGKRYMVTVRNLQTNEYSVIPAFTGYGNYKWYSLIPEFMKEEHRDFMERCIVDKDHLRNNELSDKFKVIAWKNWPNPYKEDESGKGE